MRWIVTIIVALAAGFGGAAIWDLSGLGGKATRDYLLANPEVLPEAVQVLQAREMQARLDPLRGQFEVPFPGTVLGNPKGTVTLVEFSDYSCGFCRQSVTDVKALIAQHPDLRVVIHEFPILRAESAEAARMSLAAAEQGKFEAFHDAMFKLGPPDAGSIETAAKQAGLDLALAQQRIAAGVYDGQIRNNLALGQALGLQGTPGWVIGNRMIDGAVGVSALAEAIEEARET